MELQVYDRRETAERAVADEVAALIAERRTTVLGLATGDSPAGVYRELARRHRDGSLDLSCVLTFNLDEYLGLTETDPRSFHRIMRERLFDVAGIPIDRTRFPCRAGESESDTTAHLTESCDSFERAIRDAGGIDLQLLGIGRNGHVGFNEPGSSRDSRTRVVTLHEITRVDAAQAFGGLDAVPLRAVTMGVATILGARRIRVLAFGDAKRQIVARTLAGRADHSWPATLLHEHHDARLIVDRAAAPLGASAHEIADHDDWHRWSG